MDDPTSGVEVTAAAPEREPVLAALLELYAEDFRGFHHVATGRDGRFVYEKLPLYWSEAGRHPLLVMVDGAVAGFVFVKRGSEISGDLDVWDMAEFFVVREARRLGVGSEVARKVWGLFPGRWEVRVMEANQLALGFWRHAISAFVDETVVSARVARDGAIWQIFSFEA